MSKTFKDMPYWVRLNNEGTDTDHDHLRFGKPIKKTVYLYDENDDPVIREEPVLRRAKDIVSRSDLLPWIANTNYPPYEWTRRGSSEYFMLRNTDGSYTEPILRRAHALVNQHRGNEYVEVGLRRFHASEVIITGYVRDYCTAGEKLPDDTHKYWGELPCTPAFPPAAGWWNYGTTSQRAREHAEFYTKERATGRKFEKRWAKEWNSGADLEDWDEDDHLTNDTHSYYYW